MNEEGNVVEIENEPVDKMAILHEIIEKNARNQKAYEEPNFDRGKEDPQVKKKKKMEARSQKTNRLRAGKKRKFSSRRK
jgi:hypothetical protein